MGKQEHWTSESIDGRLWLFADGEDFFVPFEDVIRLWPAEAQSGKPRDDRRSHGERTEVIGLPARLQRPRSSSSVGGRPPLAISRDATETACDVSARMRLPP